MFLFDKSFPFFTLNKKTLLTCGYFRLIYLLKRLYYVFSHFKSINFLNYLGDFVKVQVFSSYFSRCSCQTFLDKFTYFSQRIHHIFKFIKDFSKDRFSKSYQYYSAHDDLSVLFYFIVCLKKDSVNHRKPFWRYF